jgi:hypothetical protein
MENRPGQEESPLANSTVSTTTVHGPHSTTTGPHTTTTTSSTTNSDGTIITHFGPNTTTVTSPMITTTSQTPGPQPPAPAQDHGRERSSSIRIRRPTHHHNGHTPQPQPTPQPAPQPAPQPVTDDTWQAGRRRSSSEPRPPPTSYFPADAALRRQHTASTPAPLQPLYEESSGTGNVAPGTGPPPSRGPSTRRHGLNRQISAINIRRNNHKDKGQHAHQNTMGVNVVDVLDVIGENLEYSDHDILLANVLCRP